jgi:Asp-tRNA(Asn)/Glu-tRNA(Gln) amidotransferase A subunit family amidase
MSYDPRTAVFPSFARARAGFADGGSPRAFLESCLEQVFAQEDAVRAFVSIDVAAARTAADAASARWKDGSPLSPLDGLPIGIKDCYDVAGLPTRVNSAFYADAPAAEFDAAHVSGLRAGGAYVLGKTETTELTMALPGRTWNPWDLTRTPGGSSSGSAAAIAAGMLPFATGSQVRGSGIRPGSICGVPVLKPSFGALNRHGGVDPSPSINHIVLMGGTVADIWDGAQQIATTVGGDPGCTPFARGPLPEARKPLRLARQYTIGWEKTDDASKAAFERWLEQVAAAGVEIVEPDASAELTVYEEATTRTIEWFFHLFWEIRWPYEEARRRNPSAFSHIMHRHLDNAAALTIADYARALARQDNLRRMHRGFAGTVDGFVTLAHVGAGQLGQPEIGTPWYNDASSAIGAPTMNLPLLTTEGLPLGVQIMGFEGQDAAMVAVARWLLAQGEVACG